LPADELLDFEMNILNEKPVPDIELLEKEFLDKILDDYSMSVTHLNNYLDCPLKFYYLNVIRVPSSKNPASTFGSAIHHCLQQFFTEFRDTN
ncbi:PD-(D/E)XK nuclease family protein, partial [Proteus faecis]|uniref:PD-(D/E)XK nuclease family protein n=1 Tax=Proteus faecis TaxID=2050967 RepID=UPI00301D3748